MLLCGGLLYVKTSSGPVASSGDVGALGRDILNLANDLASRVTGTIAKRISLGLGTYVSLAASVFLAAQGWRGFRHADAAPLQPSIEEHA
jgi:hypothetical protein